MKTGKFLKSTLVKSIVIASTAFASLSAFAAQEVTIGYQGVYNPMKYAIDTKMFEKATGYEIKWRKFDSGAKAITAMASGAVDITMAGSSPIASAASKGLDIELIWIMENIADAEALVVSDKSGITSPSDLKGKRIAVPFVSTTHYHMLFALSQFGLSQEDVKLINMQPNSIMAAWERGDIDGAFIWDPALARIKQDGHVLISSKQLSAWGRPTFDGVIANKSFTKDNEEFVVKFLATLKGVDDQYKAEKETINAQSPLAISVAKLAGGQPQDAINALALYEFLDFDQQTSCQWLGCGEKGGATQALTTTSNFLFKEKKITKVQPDYSVYVNPTYAEKAAAM